MNIENQNHYKPVDLMPHTGFMVLLDSVISGDEEQATCAVVISGKNIFSTPGGSVPSWVGLEYMAQTIAVYAGIQAKKNGDGIYPGFIIGSRRFEPRCREFPSGQNLEICSRIKLTDGKMGVFDCVISDRNTRAELVSAQISVYQAGPHE